MTRDEEESKRKGTRWAGLIKYLLYHTIPLAPTVSCFGWSCSFTDISSCRTDSCFPPLRVPPVDGCFSFLLAARVPPVCVNTCLHWPGSRTVLVMLHLVSLKIQIFEVSLCCTKPTPAIKQCLSCFSERDTVVASDRVRKRRPFPAFEKWASLLNNAIFFNSASIRSLCLRMAALPTSLNNDVFHKEVVEASLRKYKELPKRGKPDRKKEWSPLSTFLCAKGIYIYGNCY